MTLRWKNFVPNTPLKAAEVNDLANNGCVQIDTAADLDDPNLVDANLSFDLAANKLYQRHAAGVGADKWVLLSLSGSIVWADITSTTTSTEYTDSDGVKWKVWEFTNTGDTITTTKGIIEVLAVGGGGGGGISGSFAAGGGGGGGVVHTIINVPAATGTIEVGVGGAVNSGIDGRDWFNRSSILKFPSGEHVIAFAGGGGGTGTVGSQGAPGASGGGGSNAAGGQAQFKGIQGFDGIDYAGSGAGGKATGTNAPGPGISINFNGTSTIFGAGASINTPAPKANTGCGGAPSTAGSAGIIMVRRPA